MSKDEVKREHRESEGDPEIKAARRRAHHEALAGSMIAAVKDATVLIVNPTHLATALRYDDNEDEAPLVIAHGEGDLARRLIEAAHAYNVPVVRDVPVAHALKELTLGEQIPEALYEAVAEVLRELVGSEAAAAADQPLATR
jgi:flagellar biosynthesis protein FlhB